MTEEAVLAAIAGDLARFNQPKAAMVVDDLPRNTTGKVQKTFCGSATPIGSCRAGFTPPPFSELAG